MNKNEIIKLVCLIVTLIMLFMSNMINSVLREQHFSPKFDYDNDKKVVVHHKKWIKGDTIFILTDTIDMPVIKIKSLYEKAVINSVSMYYYPPKASKYLKHINAEDLIEQRIGLDRTIDSTFVLECVANSVENGKTITRIPFVLEIEYIKRDGKGTQKQAVMFEYYQHYKSFYGVRLIENLKLHKLKNKQYLVNRFNNHIDQCYLDKDTIVGDCYIPVYESNPSCVIDTLFSF